jgi:hypothetical protein
VFLRACCTQELYRELEQSREMLLTQRRTLQHRTVGIIIGQLVAPSQVQYSTAAAQVRL